ncbi:ankyrin repeat and death domain-containing protein 1A isoform X2 [Octopus bimaculoides]|uniref:ankyrin repeat and death domain-containing protein 1A isoform X2 n=1 Tax=Octopus bimaculoides TaxID=37653 RepID=UPI00071E2464|nr:ankyrin repeat and death domain-containing protein 1A isoform X2 [Octopus bimaculoides]|eukprot:XP_014782978.1 PREDICTED: ankyrin repeat and death domain-containing protein 1A-like isoform X2 [Octopus bimaculoides]
MSDIITDGIDPKRRPREDDCIMSTMLQPSDMLKGEKKLHEAARQNNLAKARRLLIEKVDVDCKNNRTRLNQNEQNLISMPTSVLSIHLDRTALHWAAAEGNIDIIQLLLDNGTDVELRDKYGMGAVHCAAWFGQLESLKALVNGGARTTVQTKQGMNILHCAAQNNHLNILTFIADSLENFDVNQTERNDRTSLHLAADNGCIEAVLKLIAMKCDIHMKDKDGATALHLAAKKGNIDILKALLASGSISDDRDVDGRTALHIASENGYTEVCDLLLEYGANPNAETLKEMTPLHLSANHGHTDVVAKLLHFGCGVNAQNFQGNTALHLSAMGNHADTAKILVQAGCELDLPNYRLQTPLHAAVESGLTEVVEVLLAGGASLDAREKSGKTSLQLASRGAHVALVDTIIKAERYYSTAREYHNNDLGYVEPHAYLRRPTHPSAEQMKEILWRLSTKQLKNNEWKKLALYWKFKPEHIQAIEHQYVGPNSYKEHGFRLLIIWLHGIRKDENIMKLLFEALVAIDRRNLAGKHPTLSVLLKRFLPK